MGAVNDDNVKELKVIGNPVRLNATCDPYHRVSLKMQQFMTTIDLIPVEWSLDVKAFFKDEKSLKDKKGVVNYDFTKPIDKYKKRCKKYTLPEKSGIRLLTTSDSVYQESFTNNYAENMLSKAANNMSNVTNNVRQLVQSTGSGNMDKAMAELKGSMVGTETLKAQEAVTAGFGGDLIKKAWDLLMEGRQMSLPKVYQSSGYEPSLQCNIKLVSPYGSPEAIKNFILEPLVYLLLLSSPDTSDGLSYGGHTYLRVKAYGTADINLGYISTIRVDRGGPGNLCNRYGQPLSADVSITILPAIGGFACISDKSDMQGMSCDEMLTEDTLEFKPLLHAPGLTTIDNVINSFKMAPGSKKQTNNGEFPAAGGLLGAIGNMATAITSTAGAMKNSVGGAISKALM